VSFIYSIISTLPYLVVIVLLFVTLFKRKLSYIASLVIFVGLYIFADRIVKNLIRGIFQMNLDPRPVGACKKSFGFPSSHMTVMGTIVALMIESSNV
jgi:membrane-associated phospholipid phosphatase